MVNPCTDYLSDIEYLIHMIPHHQVAIDMSKLLIPKINSPSILHLCRDIIRKQGYEIWEMTIMKNKLSQSPDSEENSLREKTITKIDLYGLNKTEGKCNPLFFKPDEHMKHMKHMKINTHSYLHHMIPHHQVAIDMSRRLLKYTKNSYLRDFCKKLIYDQQYEIKYMTDLLHRNNFYYSELLNQEIAY